MTLPTRTSWSESPTLAVDAAPPPAAVEAFLPVPAAAAAAAGRRFPLPSFWSKISRILEEMSPASACTTW
jgi:hypothetical protein